MLVAAIENSSTKPCCSSKGTVGICSRTNQIHAFAIECTQGVKMYLRSAFIVFPERCCYSPRTVSQSLDIWDCFNFPLISVAEEEFEEVEDDIIDEELNEKESEEGKIMFYNLQLCYFCST